MNVLLQLSASFGAVEPPILVIHPDARSVSEGAWEFRHELLATLPVPFDCPLRCGPEGAVTRSVEEQGALVFARVRTNELHVWAGDLGDEDLLMRLGYALGRLMMVQMVALPEDGIDNRKLDAFGIAALLAARFLDEIREEEDERRTIGQNRKATGGVARGVGGDGADDPRDGIHVGPFGYRD